MGNDQGHAQTTATGVTRREFLTLNGMRGVAAIAVMLYHGVSLVGPVVPRGYLAVDLFFTLSGFVIAHAYEDRLADGLSVRSFALIRFIRFWPLYALGVGFGLLRESLLVATHNSYALPMSLLAVVAACALLFVPTPLARRDDALFPINIPSWSLFFELLVNILYAAVRPHLGTKALVAIIAVSGGTFVALAPAEGIHEVGVQSATLLSGCLRTVLSFSLGLLIYRVRAAAPKVPVLLLLALIAVLLICPWGGLLYDLLFVLLVSPLIVFLGAAVEPSARLAPTISLLGLLSFPLYAIHRPLLNLAEAASGRIPVPTALIGWSAMLIVILCAYAAGRGDPPVRRFISRKLHAALRRDRAEAAAP